jgi:hypothetical protein
MEPSTVIKPRQEGKNRKSNLHMVGPLGFSLIHSKFDITKISYFAGELGDKAKT